MTTTEFDQWQAALAEEYAAVRVSAGLWPSEGAVHRALESNAQILPQGLATPRMIIVCGIDAEGQPVGRAWVGLDHPRGAPDTAFLYDLEVVPLRRRAGIGRDSSWPSNRPPGKLAQQHSNSTSSEAIVPRSISTPPLGIQSRRSRCERACDRMTSQRFSGLVGPDRLSLSLLASNRRTRADRQPVCVVAMIVTTTTATVNTARISHPCHVRGPQPPPSCFGPNHGSCSATSSPKKLKFRDASSTRCDPTAAAHPLHERHDRHDEATLVSGQT